MTPRPCAVCGEPTDTGTRCPAHAASTSRPSRARGYDTAWDRLSVRARRMQPWCLLCGSTGDLQADHLPIAWERKAQGKPIRLQDIRVLCGPCNRAAGSARGGNPPQAPPGAPGKAEFQSHTPRGIT